MAFLNEARCGRQRSMLNYVHVARGNSALKATLFQIAAQHY
jgi:hypothetical protein